MRHIASFTFLSEVLSKLPAGCDPQVARPSKSKSEMNKIKRGGKGKHGFKSKAKHRRR